MSSELRISMAGKALPMNPPGELLIFIHIPKAAGQTFQAILKKNYPNGEILFINSIRAKEFLAYREMSPVTKGKVRCITGHISYGIHRYAKDKRCSYLTFLRNPIDRVVSHYHYVVNTPKHYLHDRVVRDGKVVMTLNDYVTECPTEEIMNGQTRMLASLDGDDLKGGVGEVDLARALNNIEKHFSFVGLVEQFDLSIVLLKQTHGLLLINYRKQNVGKKRKGIVSKKIVDTIAGMNEIDILLYQKFHDAYKNLEGNVGLMAEVKSFVDRNALYSNAAQLGNQIKGIVKQWLKANWCR